MSEASGIALAADWDIVRACEGILERHARSFSMASVFLPRKMRQNAAICYAFCRLVDDAVDEVEDENEARRRLALVEEMFNGTRAPSPIVAAYIELMEAADIGLSPARDLIAGARSDLDEVRLQTDEEFLLYCYRVAGTVGLMMCGVLGVRDVAARRHAIDLGIAMQMTNICRDVLEDARRDRVYLPEERLRSWGVETVDVLRVRNEMPPDEATRAGVSRVVREVLVWADLYYDSGAAGLRFIPARARLAIVVARALYRDIGRTLMLWGGDALLGRATVSYARKCVLTVRCVVNWIIGVVVKPSKSFQPRALRLPSK